jgi:hypothetical protein
VYSRDIDGSARTFGVSGKLWHGVLVMFDRETGSYWTQLDGRSIRGESTGERLEHFPSVFTSFGSWLDAQPDTLVLEKSERARRMSQSSYASYFADPDRLFLPHLDEGLGGAVGPKDVVFGVRLDGGSLAVTEAVMERDGVVNAAIDGTPIALLRNGVTGEVRAVRRDVGGEVLELGPAKRGEPTEKVADLATGKTFAVKDLVAVRVDRSFWYAWARTVDKGSVVIAE